MIKEKINSLLSGGSFAKFSLFNRLLTNRGFAKRYSIMKPNNPFPIGGGFYKTTFCFFFYFEGYLANTFYCEVVGFGKKLYNEDIKCYEYPCNDIGRADCWEWVDVD